VYARSHVFTLVADDDAEPYLSTEGGGWLRSAGRAGGKGGRREKRERQTERRYKEG